jgi:hypothetical protein
MACNQCVMPVFIKNIHSTRKDYFFELEFIPWPSVFVTKVVAHCLAMAKVFLVWSDVPFQSSDEALRSHASVLLRKSFVPQSRPFRLGIVNITNILCRDPYRQGIAI